MLKVGAVEAPRGHHHDARVIHQRAFAQGLQEVARVTLHWRNVMLLEHLRIEAHHHLTVFEHVGDAGRRTQVILQHVVLTVVIAHHIDAGDMGIGVVWQVDALHARLILLVGQHLLGRDQPRAQNILLMIDVIEEGVERFHPLANAAVNALPLPGGYDPRHAIKRDQPLGSLILAVHVKGDADTVKKQFRLRFFLPDRELIGVAKPLPPGIIVRPLFTLRGQHLVIIMPVR